jgi:hypothetical protein
MFVVNDANNNNVATTSSVPPSKASTRKAIVTPTKPTEPTTENPDEILKNSILNNLTDSDFVMETPSAALFTLIFGKKLSMFLSFLD